MGISKKDQYTKKQLNHARIGRAIAAPARVVILQEINKKALVSNRELSSILELSGSTVAQHLQILRETGFVESCFIGMEHGSIFRKDAQEELRCIDWLWVE